MPKVPPRGRNLVEARATSRELAALGRLERAAERLRDLLGVEGFENLARKAGHEVNRLAKRTCEVPIVGEFKRGKSTLVNALLEADVAPVGALPLTAIATVVEYGAQTSCEVELTDGTRLAVEPSAVDQYATERGEKLRSRTVARVRLTGPSSILACGLRLVDTPGIESVYGDVSAVAREVFTSADAAVIVLEADQPASRREQELVREVVQLGIPAIVVVNRIDLVPAPEREELVQFVRDVVRQAAGDRRIHVVALSAHAARQAQRRTDERGVEASGLPGLEEELRKLTGSAGKEVLAAAVRGRLERVIDEALTRGRVRWRAPTLLRHRRDDRQTWLEQQVNALLLKQALDGSRLLAARIAEIRAKLFVSSPELHRETLPSVTQENCERASPRIFAARISDRLRTDIERRLSHWSAEDETALSMVADEIAAEQRARAADLLRKLGLSEEAVLLPMTAPSSPQISLPTPPLARRPLLPGALGRRQVVSRARRWFRDSAERLRRERQMAAGNAIESNRGPNRVPPAPRSG